MDRMTADGQDPELDFLPLPAHPARILSILKPYCSWPFSQQYSVSAICL